MAIYFTKIAIAMSYLIIIPIDPIAYLNVCHGEQVFGIKNNV